MSVKDGHIISRASIIKEDEQVQYAKTHSFIANQLKEYANTILAIMFKTS